MTGEARRGLGRWTLTVVTIVTISAVIGGVAYINAASSSSNATCSITGQPGDMYLRVVSDSNLVPIVGANVQASNEPASVAGYWLQPTACNKQRTVSFTTDNKTGWYQLSGENNLGYSFVVTYLGQTYHFSASLRPLLLTCVTLSVPSGRTNITNPMQPPCLASPSNQTI